MLFVASAIKTFVLCEALRQVDAHDVVEKLETKELVLDSTVWSLDRLTFNPPDLTGLVSERTTLEAMITRSDNTATDMMFKLAGAANVRRFIAAAGLRRTLMPDSARLQRLFVRGRRLPDTNLGASAGGSQGTDGASLSQRCRDSRILGR